MSEIKNYKGKEIKVTPEEINKKLQDIIDKGTNFGHDFVFRPHQRKAIVKIAFLYLNEICKNVILDAPTGTGKSVIAILAARLLREWKKEGYLITSNLDLQDQYMRDVHSYNLMWGSVKGVDNYNCDVNHLPFSLGECRSRGYSKQKIESLECYTSCGYHMSKLRAQNAAISVLNYSYWLIQRNYVAAQMPRQTKTTTTNGINFSEVKAYDEPFTKRDFCFFDEAHKVDDIVQSHFSLTLNDKVLEKVLEHIEYMDQHGLMYDKNIVDVANIMLDYSTIMDEGDYKSNAKALRNFKKVLHELNLTKERLQTTMEKYTFGQNNVPIYLRNAIKRCEMFKDVSCKLSDYLEIVDEDNECFVKTCDQGNNSVVFNLLKDQVLLQNKLHDQSNFSIFMSATFGDPVTWAELCGVEDYEIISIPNQWESSRSPIYMSKKLPSLSFAKRDESIGSIMKALDDILENNANVKGIIHTGNFFFTQHILTNSKHKKRFHSYQSSRERADSIEKFKKSSNGILIGPSLTEGLDLKDELSRFQIFIKVPYRVITDNYTKLRMKHDSRWYNWKTTLSFIQALGRSIRNENDWAVTYLLDGNFRDYFRHNSKLLPKHIAERIQYF